MDASNFGVDPAGRLVILDFGEIGWLPESLDLYTLFRTTAFAQKVAVRLFGPDEAMRLGAQPNLASIAGVRMLLGQAARPGLSTSVHSQWLETRSDRFSQIWTTTATRGLAVSLSVYRRSTLKCTTVSNLVSSGVSRRDKPVFLYTLGMMRICPQTNLRSIAYGTGGGADSNNDSVLEAQMGRDSGKGTIRKCQVLWGFGSVRDRKGVRRGLRELEGTRRYGRASAEIGRVARYSTQGESKWYY